MKRTDIAYLAGIFDGEGHVSIHRTRAVKVTRAPIHFLEIGITNTDKELINILLLKHKGKVGSTGIRDNKRLPAYRWRLTGPSAVTFLKMLYPYLTIKKKQAEIGMAFQREVSIRPKGGIPLTDLEVARRDEYKDLLVKSRRDKTVRLLEKCHGRGIGK